MFKVKDSTIHCSRGDKGTITMKLPITDNNDYIEYKDTSSNIYWYDKTNDILYDSEYKESTVSIDTLTMVYYTFAVGDKVTLNVYEKNGYGKDPLMTKTTTVETELTQVEIDLTEEDTTFGNVINKATIYWYDVTLNDDLTVVCYDEDGAKEFIQYPAKGDDE